MLTKQKEENPMPPTESPSDVPNIFADFFLNKIQKIREQFHGQSTEKSYHRKCSKLTGFLPLEKEEILNIIKNMNPTTCIIDPCNTRFLLKFKGTILDAITIIVNQSLTTGEFLDDWKMAIVRPLIKGPNLDTKLKNYRPISNLSFLSKIIEKAAQLQLQKHFDQQSLLPNHQIAYRKHYSMETTLLNMCDNILRNMENGKCTSIVSLDLSAPFNMVNHTILLDVLNGYFGISEHALTWISSYLSSRKFLVQIGHLTSKTVEIDFSVPQGSILGPILFNCYASTLMEIIPERKDSFLSGYADDHAIIHSFSPDNNNIKQIIESDIGKTKTWMEENQLKINEAKTEFIVIGTSSSLWKNTLDHIEIGNTKIHWSSKIKFLGVILDEKLSFKVHIQNRSKWLAIISDSSVTFKNTLILIAQKCCSAFSTESVGLCKLNTIKDTENHH